MTLDFSRCPLPPFQHQKEDVAWLLEHPYALVASEMRTGKSKTVLDAAQFLFEAGRIDRVIIVAPAPVRNAVWFDETLGQIQKHAWVDVHLTVTEYSSRILSWVKPGKNDKPLDFYVSNFEFIRSGQKVKLDAKTSVPGRLAELIPLCTPKTLLIGDESSFLKNWTAQQTKAFMQLRKRCGWCWLLNGTPIFHSPLDLFSQANILHHAILDCPYITLFKARYAVQTPVLERGKPMKRYGRIIYEVEGWTNLDDLERRLKPYTIRRLQKDCLDLPPKLDPVTLTATLEPETWKVYKEMRDELVVWLTTSRVATSASAAVKALRLSQITGGFIGGVEDANIESLGIETRLDWTGVDFKGNIQGERVPDLPEGLLDWGTSKSITIGEGNEVMKDWFEVGGITPGGSDPMITQNSSVEIGREKLDVLLWLIEQQLEKDPNLHLVAWTRFRAEVFRMVAEVKKKFPRFQTGPAAHRPNLTDSTKLSTDV